MNSFNGIEEESERGHGKKGSQLRVITLTAKGVQAIHRKTCIGRKRKLGHKVD